jgi:ribosomal protein L37AE/L43A
MAGCPFCGSSNITKFDSRITTDAFRCRNCNQEWKIENGTGQILSIVGTVLTGALTFFAIFGGSDNNNNS